MMLRRKLPGMRKHLMIVSVLVLTLVAWPASAYAQPPPGSPPGGGAPQVQHEKPDPDRVTDPDRTLGKSWRSSADRAVTTVGDETGLHVLVADERDAYAWRDVATLAEPAFQTDRWIG